MIHHKPTNKPSRFLTIVAPVFKKLNCIHIICNAFLLQTDPSWNLILVHDGEDCPEANNIANQYTKDPRINYYSIPQGNCWGHNCRNFGLYKTTTEWVVLSGHDNYYVPTFVESLESFLDRNNHKLDLVYWNMIHNYYRYNFSKPPEACTIDPSGPDPYFLPQTELQGSKIDIGCFAVRTKIAVKSRGLRQNHPATDWAYLHKILKTPNIRTARINRCLYVHN
jgi:hypothetical protein